MKTKQTNPPNNPVHSLSKYFKFNNEETYREISKILSGYEGVLPNKEEEYLRHVHGRTSGELFLATKRCIYQFWKDNPQLPLTELVGAFNVTLLDVQMEIINNSNKQVKEMQNGLEKAGFSVNTK